MDFCTTMEANFKHSVLNSYDSYEYHHSVVEMEGARVKTNFQRMKNPPKKRHPENFLIVASGDLQGINSTMISLSEVKILKVVQ